MWERKIVTASMTALIYAFLLAAFVVLSLESDSGGLWDNVNGLLLLTAVYLAYSFPAIVTYGVLTSIFSDWLARRVPKRFETIVSFGLHIGFGLVLLWLSLGAAVLFWTIDRWLKHKGRRFESRQALSSLVVPAGVLLAVVGIVYFVGMVQDVVRHLYG
ncbi:hypothetical protein [Exiguobacterium sp. s142]|uniref:hypothetical protein n=1 Tax=Exiguobacterium sp. s142 TaxID=2751222 RepID=UPI001BE95DCF|nr:hypothetical protein [Exiguobacterium sp. s142]